MVDGFALSQHPLVMPETDWNLHAQSTSFLMAQNKQQLLNFSSDAISQKLRNLSLQPFELFCWLIAVPRRVKLLNSSAFSQVKKKKKKKD